MRRYFGPILSTAALGAALLLGGAGLAPTATLASTNPPPAATLQQYSGACSNLYSGYSAAWSGSGYPSYNWLGATGNSYPGSGLSAWSASSFRYATGPTWTSAGYMASNYTNPRISSYGYAYNPSVGYYSAGCSIPSVGNTGSGHSDGNGGYNTGWNGTSYLPPVTCHAGYNSDPC